MKRCTPLLLLLLFTLSACAKRAGQALPKLYLAIIWHQHQPSYYDAMKDQLIAPWVRTHATKDYYDMAATVEKYPKVHVTINLTSVLLRQLNEIYVERLGPFVDTKNSRVDAEGFLAKWDGHTDPWIDLALKDVKEFSPQDYDYLYNRSGKQAWNCFSISEFILRRFPEYRALIPEGRSVGSLDGSKEWKDFTDDDLTRIKFFFYLANFDPIFLLGPVTLPTPNPDGSPMVVDLSSYVNYDNGGTPQDDADDNFTLAKPITQADCNRLVAEAYKVMANVVAIHKRLMYHPTMRRGQIEVITTPYYHPILPLIYDSDIAKVCQPRDALPPRFSYPRDAENQVIKGIGRYQATFGEKPSGMWPGEGSVAEEVVGRFANHGIRWIATGPHVLAKSIGKDNPDALTKEELAQPYRADDDATKASLAILFRDLRLSDAIAFDYLRRTADENVREFFNSLEAFLPKPTEKDRLLTVLLDGENAWEWFQKDNDGVKFLNGLYAELERRYDAGQIISVTPSEYIDGNPARGIEPHAVESMPKIQRLWPGCWFTADFSTWIGEPEENQAWEYLLRARKDLEATGLPAPDPTVPGPKESDKKAWAVYHAYEEIYAAEGSDWFWWYGQDQTAGSGGDRLFDENFRLHLMSMYRYVSLAGAALRVPEFRPIIR